MSPVPDKSTRGQRKHSFEVNVDFVYIIPLFQFSRVVVHPWVFPKVAIRQQPKKKIWPHQFSEQPSCHISHRLHLHGVSFTSSSSSSSLIVLANQHHHQDHRPPMSQIRSLENLATQVAALLCATHIEAFKLGFINGHGHRELWRWSRTLWIVDVVKTAK